LDVIFWYRFTNISRECTSSILGLKNKPSRQLTTCLFSLPLCSSEMSVNFYQTARHHISENSTLLIICWPFLNCLAR
jgi:hypothetical protein